MVSETYNPGLATAAFLFLPLGGVYFRLMRKRPASLQYCGFSLLWGVAAQAVMIACPYNNGGISRQVKRTSLSVEQKPLAAQGRYTKQFTPEHMVSFAVGVFAS